MLQRFARFWDVASSCTVSGYMPDTPSLTINCRITFWSSISSIGKTVISSAQSAERHCLQEDLSYPSKYWREDQLPESMRVSGGHVFLPRNSWKAYTSSR